MRLSDLKLVLREMPIETFNTVGDFSRNSAYRQPADRRLLTNPKTVERAKSMWANTQDDFRFWFINNAEANRAFAQGVVDMAWMQQNMPKSLAEIQQQGGFGDQSINMIYAGNKGGNWRPMTGWMMAHRMAHMVLDGRGSGGISYNRGERPMDYIAREIIQNISGILQAYNIELPRARTYDLFGPRPTTPVLYNLFKQLGTMKSARSNNVDSGYEFIFECFAQYLMTGAVKFNPLPDALIVGYSYGRPQYRRVYGPVDKEQADDYAGYIADILGQEFERALNSVRGKIVIM
jgi:hypothetical protein